MADKKGFSGSRGTYSMKSRTTQWRRRKESGWITCPCEFHNTDGNMTASSACPCEFHSQEIDSMSTDTDSSECHCEFHLNIESEDSESESAESYVVEAAQV